MDARDQEFAIHLPYGRSYGPYVCSKDVDVANHLLELADAYSPRIGTTPFCLRLPRRLSEYILVIVYPVSPRHDSSFEELEQTVVYGVECKEGETLTEDDVRNQLRAGYANYDDSGRCFCVYKRSEVNEQAYNPNKYGRGTIFTAADPDSFSPFSPSSGSITRCSNSAPHTDMSLLPIMASSDLERPTNYVLSNQNLVLANSPNSDGTRKVPPQMDDAQTQVLVPDLPHLEQKSPLQNVGDLAGSTGLQSILVTPSTEQHDLAGPLPCSGKDKSPVIVVRSPSEEREAEEKEEVVQPLSESSKSVSTSPESTSRGDNFLEPYRRQRSSSGEDLVAPKLQKSHTGMVTGRTLSLPPNIRKLLSEKVLLKSTQRDSTGCSSSGLQRTQSDLSALVDRKSSTGAMKLLLNCSVVHGASDDLTDGRSSECKESEPKMRRRSMSDLGLQRQERGDYLDKDDILELGVPVKTPGAHNTSAKDSRQRLTSTIHEGEQEEESGMKSPTQNVLSLNATASQTTASFCDDSSEKSQSTSKHQPKESRVPPLFRLGSMDEASLDKGNELCGSHLCERQSCECSVRCDDEEHQMEKGGDEQVGERDLGNSRSALPQREVRQQVHIMEHVYNGGCVFGDACPRLPSAESLRQMSGIIERHRNGILEPALLEWLKNLIRAHCCGCRDPYCRVPHLAAGCALPGAAGSFVSSSGSAIASLSMQQSLSQFGAGVSDKQEHVAQQVTSLSFDLHGNLSNSDQVKEYFAQLADQSRYQIGYCGANLTDNPSTHPQTGYFAPPTNASSPNDGNPMVCTPPDYHHPRPSMLPEVHQGIGPVAALMTSNTGRKNLSPLPSTGFPPLLLYSRPLNREPARSPIQQASDVGTGMLNLHQACYIQPNKGRSNYVQGRHFSQLSPSELPDVRLEGFPHSSKYSSIDAGVFIYCSEHFTSDTGFSLGAFGHPPNPQRADVLGRGGNGSVFGYFQNGEQFAVKKTTYRQTELKAWLNLDHPNVLPLLGVMWGGHCCYQFMPKMTSDLSTVMRSLGDLCTLVRSTSRVHWENVLRPNVQHVVKSLVSGVKYLHDKGIQHYDLKSSNVLICKPVHCRCDNLFSCECPLQSKCEVRISDFDSVKVFPPGLCAASVRDVACEPKPDIAKVLGTPYYRAPEQFKQLCGQLSLAAEPESLEGPWCDMWAIGVIVTQLCLGKQRNVEREKVHRTIVSSPVTLPSSNPTPEVEGFVARERLSTLREKCIACQQLAPLATIAAQCLEPDFRCRVTAEHLLRNDFFL